MHTDLTHNNIGLTSIRYFITLMEILSNEGISSHTLLDGTGLRQEDFEDPNGYLPSHQIRPLLGNALRLSKNKFIGIQLGRQLNVSSHGILGYAGLVCSTPFESINVAIKYFPLITSLIKVSYGEFKNDQGNVFGYVEINSATNIDRETEDFILETIISSFDVMARFILGSPSDQGFVELTKPPTTDLLRQTDKAKLNIRFGRKYNRIIFPREHLDIPSPLADDNAKEQAITQCQQQLKALRGRSKLGEQILQQLMLEGDNFSNIETIAEQMHVSSRTLRRKLDQENTSYRQLLDEARISLAKKYLGEEKLPVTQVAFLLGYKDSANFSRAFKRITGITPTQHIEESNTHNIQ